MASSYNDHNQQILKQNRICVAEKRLNMSTSATGTQIKVSPHTIPGMLHQQNQGAFDW